MCIRDRGSAQHALHPLRPLRTERAQQQFGRVGLVGSIQENGDSIYTYSAGDVYKRQVLGVAFAFLTPPLVGPDEYTHLAKCYRQSSTLLGHVSYTHLDVYKRQVADRPPAGCSP